MYLDLCDKRCDDVPIGYEHGFRTSKLQSDQVYL